MAPSSAPAIGATQNSQSWPSAQPPTNTATPVLRAGFTEVFWHPNRPQLLNQGGTGIFPEYRNNGLGRWLKAAMLHKVLRERPEVKFVRTSNADSNAPMVKINRELGFKPYISQCMWQVEVEKTREYLASEQLAVNSQQ